MLQLEASEVKCELCPNKGGALKPTVDGKWVHCLCANWIPDVFCEDIEKIEPFTLAHINKERWSLRCKICSKKGVCIQCSSGRCSVAAHPWCALRSKSGFTHRIIKAEDSDDTLWEIFCKKHAKAVKEASKPNKLKSLKPKATESFDDSSISNDVNSGSNVIRRSSVGGKGGNARKYKSNVYDEEEMEESPHNEVDASFTDFNAFRKADSSSSTEKSGKNEATFPILTMSEWPGQSEGEFMDLNHFWNVASTYFPESQSLEVPKHLNSSIVDLIYLQIYII